MNLKNKKKFEEEILDNVDNDNDKNNNNDDEDEYFPQNQNIFSILNYF